MRYCGILCSVGNEAIENPWEVEVHLLAVLLVGIHGQLHPIGLKFLMVTAQEYGLKHVCIAREMNMSSELVYSTKWEYMY